MNKRTFFKNMSKRNEKRNSAFTLMEVLISVTLAAILLNSAYYGFRSGMLAYKKIEKSLRIDQAARQVLDRIHSDLRNAFWYSNKDARFSGNEKKLTFFSLVDHYFTNKRATRYALVSYDWDGKKLKRVCRVTRETLNLSDYAEIEDMGFGLRDFGLSYGYIDRKTGKIIFVPIWEKINYPPIAVKTKLIFGDKHFERLTILPLAYAYENITNDSDSEIGSKKNESPIGNE